MNDAWGYDENDNQQDPNLNNGPKPLRDAYAAQKKANDELMARLAVLEAENKRTKVADLFESQGAPRSAAQYYGGDPDADKVSAYINDMRAAFGGAPAPAATPAAPTIDPNDAQKLQSLMQAGANGAVPGNEDTLLSVINDPNTSTADRVAAWTAYAARQNG